MHVDYRFDGYFAEAKPVPRRRDRAYASLRSGHWALTVMVGGSLWASIAGLAVALCAALGGSN